MPVVLKAFFIPFLISFGLLLVFPSFAGNGEPKKEDKTSIDIPPEIDKLCINFKKAICCDNDILRFDSIASNAIAIAESKFDHELILYTNLKVLSCLERGNYNLINFEELVKRSEQIELKQNQQSGFKTWLTISQSAAKLYHSEYAHQYALKAFSEANLGEKNNEMVEAYLALGKSLLLMNQYMESYQNYLHAKYQVELIQDKKEQKRLKKECYDHFFDFFDQLQDFEQAGEYKYEHILQIVDDERVDSMELMWAKLDLLGLSIRAKKYRNIKRKFDELLEFAAQKDHKKLNDYTLTIYRTYLIENNDSEGFYELYFDRFPEELSLLEDTDPLSFHRIKAHISDFLKDYDKAIDHYKAAEELIQKEDRLIYKSNFYRRYGQFLMNKGRDSDALAAFERSYELASKHPYLEFMIESSAYIDSLSFAAGNIEKAYRFSSINHDLLIQQSELTENEEIMMMNLRNESKRMELLKEQEKEAQKKRFDMQYLLITILICILLIILLVSSQMKVPLWVIKGSSFLAVLMVFEFIILVLDQEIHHITHGAPLWIFLIKVVILFILFPLHHLAEKSVINYMSEKKMVLKPQKVSLKKIMHTIWPWMKEHK